MGWVVWCCILSLACLLLLLWVGVVVGLDLLCLCVSGVFLFIMWWFILVFYVGWVV